MKKIFMFTLSLFLLTACSESKKEPVKKENQLALNQSNFVWGAEDETQFLQLQEEDGELDALLTITKLNEGTYNFEDQTISLEGKRIGNKFSLATGKGIFSHSLSGKIERNKIIIDDKDGKKEFIKISEEKYDSILGKYKQDFEEKLTDYAIEVAKKFYEEKAPVRSEKTKFEATNRKESIIEVSVCIVREDECKTDNSFQVNISNGQVIPLHGYELSFGTEQEIPLESNIEYNLEDYDVIFAENMAKDYYKVNVGEPYPELRFAADHVIDKEYIVVRLYEVHKDRDVTVNWYKVHVENGQVLVEGF